MPSPGPGQVLIRIAAIGVNFIDVNQRSGAYPVSYPFIPGTEAAGVVVAAGEGVDEISAGERVGFAGGSAAYADHVVIAADRLVPIPDGIASDVAAAALLQGMTAHYLINSICRLEQGDWCLIHAAAGGVGSLLVQLAKSAGLHVIGTVSTQEKATHARRLGADIIVNYTNDDFAEAARDATAGAGVRVVLDSVGKGTFDSSLRTLAPRGYMVLFGQASGPVQPVEVGKLQHAGSLFLTRPRLVDYVASRQELLHRATAIFRAIEDGTLQIHIHERYPLRDAAVAHRVLESRRSIGKLLLVPHA